MIEREIKFATVNLNIVEERNLTFIHAVGKIYITFSLFPNLNSDITNEFTNV